MTNAPLRPTVMVRGDPNAIRESAQVWRRMGDQCTVWALSVRGCRCGGFIGDEAALFESHLCAFSNDFDRAAQAWHVGAVALARFADRLDTCQRELALLEWQALSGFGGMGGDGNVGHDRDPGMLRHILGRAEQLLAEHDHAVARCSADLTSAAALLPKVPAVPGATLRRAVGPATSGTTGSLGLANAAMTGQGGWASAVVTGSRGSLAGPVEARVASTALRGIAAGLRTVSGIAGLLTATPSLQSAGDLFSEIAELLGVASLALAVFGGSGGGTGLAIAGGTGAVVAAPEVGIGAAAMAAGVGLGILIAAAVKGESPGEVIDDALHPTIAGTPTADMHVIAKMNRDSLPPDVLQEVDDAIARAKAGGNPRFPGHDGREWRNTWGQLPAAPEGYYTEWTAAPNRAGRGWDQQHRVIIAGDPANPDAIYYWDHTPGPMLYIGP